METLWRVVKALGLEVLCGKGLRSIGLERLVIWSFSLQEGKILEASDL